MHGAGKILWRVLKGFNLASVQHVPDPILFLVLQFFNNGVYTVFYFVKKSGSIFVQTNINFMVLFWKQFSSKIFVDERLNVPKNLYSKLMVSNSTF